MRITNLMKENLYRNCYDIILNLDNDNEWYTHLDNFTKDKSSDDIDSMILNISRVKDKLIKLLIAKVFKEGDTEYAIEIADENNLIIEGNSDYPLMYGKGYKKEYVDKLRQKYYSQLDFNSSYTDTDSILIIDNN